MDSLSHRFIISKKNIIFISNNDIDLRDYSKLSDNCLVISNLKNLNFNNKSDILDILQSKRSDTLYNLKPKVIDTNLVINLPSELSQNFERTKLVLKDGSEIPEWLSYDPNSGKIIAEPPEDISKLDLKLIIERDGEIIVKDLSIEFGADDTAQNDELNNEKIDNKFVSLKDQLDKEFTSWDDYGSNVINRL